MTSRDELKIIDIKLADELNKLPADYLFFNNDEPVTSPDIHMYPTVLASSVSRTLIGIIKKYQGIKTLLDPFMGSGTNLMEGIFYGIDAVYGNDLNPLAYLISRAKTTLHDYSSLKSYIEDFIRTIYSEFKKYEDILENVENYIRNKKGLDITSKYNWGSDAPEYLNEYFQKHGAELRIAGFTNIGYWFLPRVISELQIIKNCMNRVTDEAIRNFIRVAFSETVRLVSNKRSDEYKMSRLTVEELKTYSPNTQNEFINILKGSLEKMANFYGYCDNPANTKVHLYCEDAKELGSITDNSIDLMITSPPYGDSRSTASYGEFSKMSLLWLDDRHLSNTNITDIDKSLLGGAKFKKGFTNNLSSKTLKNSLEIIKDQDRERAGDVYSFYLDLDKCIQAITRKMKVNSYQCWAVENRNVKMVNLKTNKIIEELGKQHGLQHVYTIDCPISQKAASNVHERATALSEKSSVLTNSHVIILRKV